MTEYPPEIEKKVKLLNYFMNYMKEHLLKAGANMQSRDGDELSRIPFLRTWFRTSRAVVMFLTNGTVQVIQVAFYVKLHTKFVVGSKSKPSLSLFRSTFSKTIQRLFCVH